MYRTEIMRERVRELRLAGQRSQGARTGALHRVRAFARRHTGR